jgi:hypothetical protein
MLNNDDKFHLIMELMNANMEDAVLYFTITYDYVEGHPAGWKNLKPVWFDVANCGTRYFLHARWESNSADCICTAK